MDNIYYSHEHVTIDLSGIKQDLDCRLDDFDQTAAEFKDLHARGVRVVVDQTARGMGRNAAYAQSIAEDTGVRVLHATGFYKEPFLPEECYRMTKQELAALLIKDICVGIDGTDIRANHIGEVGTGVGAIKPEELKVFEAACFAHHETGAPICTHCTLGTLGLEQLELFEHHQVPLEKVVLSHIDLSGDYDYMLALVDRGVNIAFDTIGKENYMPDAKRIERLVNLCQAGYMGQIVLSMDVTRKSHFLANGGLGYTYLLDHFLPRLEAAGCKAEWINQMLSENPRRIYGE